MKNKSGLIISLSMIVGLFLYASEPGDSHSGRLTVHEWGTFTVLQDESGSPIPGVNINEESLPPFVHVLSPGLSPDTHKFGPLFDRRLYQGRPQRAKGIARFDPAVTMRMETPIIYFHLPEQDSQPRKLDVEVSFRHGWISEWYPDAKNEAPGFVKKYRRQEPITSATTGRITWSGITVGDTGGKVPATEEHVWLAPRNVKSAPVTTAKGQTENYLFYRGVANLEAPLRVIRSEDGSQLNIIPNKSFGGKLGRMAFPSLWLADIREDGTTAFRTVKGISAQGSQVRTTQGGFEESDYTAGNMKKLRSSMKEAVVADGLYEDEADALLNTWEVSYFKSSGLRLFFLLPQKWTDAVLPMKLSEPADIDRIMIGRIELVTPEQRDLLAQIGAVPSHDQKWFLNHFQGMTEAAQNSARSGLLAGGDSLEDHGFKVPPSYSNYIAMGRFRDALVVDQIRKGGTRGLAEFARTYGIRYFNGW